MQQHAAETVSMLHNFDKLGGDKFDGDQLLGATADISSVYSNNSRKSSADTLPDLKIKLNQNLILDNSIAKQWVKDRTTDEWINKVFPEAAMFQGFDELLWGSFMAIVYKDPSTDKISSIILDKLGTSHFNSIDLSKNSRFYPAVENLTDENKKSNVRRCIAISLLQKFSQLSGNDITKISSSLKYDYDQTTAGDLANSCKLIGFATPQDLGKSLINMGLLQDRFVQSVLLDVVYENKEESIDANNQLVFHLGEQLEQLFNPLTEYSPEQTEYVYKPPSTEEENAQLGSATSTEKDDALISSICDELMAMQTNFTLNLVEFLQTFLIPLRIEVLNEEIHGLSTSKLNRLFPPTIDEVTRINCIFLDALKAAIPYGSLEVLKACSVTIPYFYKAYTRHEAATKNFSKDIKLFFRKFGDIVPSKNIYTEMKIDTIIKGPQEKLTKLKLIINRLWKNKTWTSKEAEKVAKRHFDNISEVIDSFGKLETTASAYNTRVFTPSGKILTELANGWPVELQYKWLKRRVVGVFDAVDANDNTKRDIIVIFSDYVVFLNVIDGDLYYTKDSNRPLISDILMNSLINEVPLPPIIPKLKVVSYSYVDNLLVSIYGEKDNFLRFDILQQTDQDGKTVDSPVTMTYKLVSSTDKASHVADLVTKAKILEKDTAFHLFKTSQNGLQIYSTAHETDAYLTEKMKSRFALFLNISPSKDLIENNNLCLGLFASLSDDNHVQVEKVTIDGLHTKKTVSLQEFTADIIEEMVNSCPIYLSTCKSPLYGNLSSLNEKLVKRIGRHFHELELNEPPENAMDLFENNKTGDFSTTHKKSKSFGTITTFRSSVDEAESAAVHATVDIAKQTLKPKKQTMTKKVENTANPLKKERRKSFMTKLSSLFNSTKKNKKQKEVPPKKINNSKKTHNSVYGKKERTERNTNEGYEYQRGDRNNRIESVIHDTKFQSIPMAPQSKGAVPPSSESIKSVEVPANIAPEATKPSPDPEKLDEVPIVNSKSDVASEYEISTNSVGYARQNSRSSLEETSDNIIYKQSERQSQIFNVDLFGDIVPNNEEIQPVGKMVADNGSVAERVSHEHNTAASNSSSLMQSNGEDENPATNMDHDVQKDTVYSPQPSTEITGNDDITTLEGGNSVNSLCQKQKAASDDSTKQPMFPKIPEYELPKVTFDRSPSFVELFEGMRIVLEENDESSNWRRLSSDVSLNERNIINTNNSNTHAFKNFVSANRLPVVDRPATGSAEVASTITPSTPPQTSTNTSIMEELVTEEVVDVPDHTKTSKESQDEESIQNQLEKITELAFLGSHPSEIYTSKVSSFRVTKTSPTKIISGRDVLPNASNVQTAHHLITENSTNGAISSDFSYSSNIDITNERLLELSFHSQEEITENIKDHVSTNGSLVETRGNESQSCASEPSDVDVLVKNIGKTSQETVMRDVNGMDNTAGTNNQKHQPILEDIDFSSFHMTFDTTDDTNNVEEIPEMNRIPMLTKPDPKLQEPVFYRLSDAMKSNETFFSCTDNDLIKSGRRANKLQIPEEDEPMWVSPSKLDMFDLSKQPDTVFQNTKLKPRMPYKIVGNTPKQLKKDDSLKFTEPALVTDSSYAYLGPVLLDDDLMELDDDEINKMDDKPTRLKFKP